MLVLAILVGLGSGAGVLLFRWFIDLAQEFYWHQLAVVLASYSSWAIALIPIIGGLVVSALRLRLQQTEAGFGSLSNAVAKEGGRLPYAQIPLKTMAAALSLGAGASLGPEGPSVELGSNIGSLLGQLLRFSTERTRLLVGAGAAAGLAAGFNAPIAGVFFALEVLLGDTFGTTKTNFNSNVSVVVIAAVVSALVAQIGLGGQPAFNLPAYEVRSYWELPLYLGLGLLASLVAVVFSKALELAQEVFAGKVVGFDWMAKLSIPAKLTIGGCCIGATVLVFPEVMGVGYETVESLLQDAHYSVGLLVVLLFTKLVLTAISLGSGFVGGIFAPAIFLGAILGSAYGQVLSSILPDFIPVAAPPAYALVGMAAVLAGTVRAPLTAVLLLFEMTRDYRIVLPLMAAVGLCAWMVEQLQAYQISATGSNKPAHDEDINALSTIKIAEVMTVHPLTFKYSTPILQAAQVFTSGYFHSALIVDDSHHLLGILTTQDIERALSLPNLSHQINQLTVRDICTKEVLHTFADESLADAIRRMATRDLQQLPVVDRNSTSRVVGMVDRQAITAAYTNALTKQAIADKIASNKAESPNIIEPKEIESIAPSEIRPDDLRSEALSIERML
jgi:H+/Cl- antiporter ClcA/predicted transcriptional regulator